MKIQPGSTCADCKVGKLVREEATFVFDKDGQSMWVEKTPCLECPACLAKTFDKAISNELIKKSKTIFAQSSCFGHIYQLNDLIRPSKEIAQLKSSDTVRIKDDVDTWDMYDEALEPGMEGTIIEKGKNPFDWLVEFRLGKTRSSYLQIEIDCKDIELVSAPTVQVAKRKTQ
ncbi:hypothetical protein BH11CYA1_BH11CYA1_50760 [soil metagenome]